MTDETRSPDPRMGLGGPSVGGTRGENESPRELTSECGERTRNAQEKSRAP